MTAEIAIMNKEAIALASDSAVTVDSQAGQKIFSSTNKLFALSKYHPVGIMVYGSATFMGIPWETIIKIYRKKLSQKKFGTLNKYAEDFIGFLNTGAPLFPKKVQDNYARSNIYAYFSSIKEGIFQRVHHYLDDRGEIEEGEIKRIVAEEIEASCQIWSQANSITSIPKDHSEKVVKRYKSDIDKAINEIFENLPITVTHRRKLTKITGSLFSKFPKEVVKGDVSGVVIAGFGEEDTFPSLESFHLEGITLNRLKHQSKISQKIDFENNHASIIPFAQTEMVATFMEGIDPSYDQLVISYLSKILGDYPEIVVGSIKKCNDKEKRQLKKKLLDASKTFLKDLTGEFEAHREEHYMPIVNVVSILLKDELAAMAEALVNLTSFKRKVTMESETVGGPIDVAVISKGDGLIWIKRKHYFDSKLNPQFLASYYSEV